MQKKIFYMLLPGLIIYCMYSFLLPAFAEGNDSLDKEMFIEQLNLKIADRRLVEVINEDAFDKYVWKGNDPAGDWSKYQDILSTAEATEVDIEIEVSSGREYLVYKRAESWKRVCAIELSKNPVENALDNVIGMIGDAVLNEETPDERICVFVTPAGYAVMSSLIDAVKKGQVATVKVIIADGADVNAKDASGNTPLHLAVEKGSQEIVNLLIADGADVNAKDASGETPLYKTVEEGYQEIVELLVAAGADVNAKDNNGNSLIQLILSNWNRYGDDRESATRDVVRFLGQKGISLNEELTQMVESYPKSYRYYESTRKEIVRFASFINPSPAISEDARRAAIEGETAFKFAKNASGFEEAKKRFQEAADAAPWWADPYYNLGLVLEKLREFDKAKNNFELYAYAAPGASDIEAVKKKISELEYLQKRKVEAENYIDAGADAFNAGNDYQAIQAYKKAIEIDPDIGLAHANLGVAYGRLEKHQEAIVELKEGIRLGAKGAYVYTSLGRSYKMLGNLQEAINILEEGKIEGGSYGMGFLLQKLGNYYEQYGNYEKALANFENALWYSSDDQVDEKWVNEMIVKLKIRLGR